MYKILFVLVIVLIFVALIPSSHAQESSTDVMLTSISHHFTNGENWWQIAFGNPRNGHDCPLLSELGTVDLYYEREENRFEVREFPWACDDYDTDVWLQYAQNMDLVFLSEGHISTWPDELPPAPFTSWYNVYMGMQNLLHWQDPGYYGPWTVLTPVIFKGHFVKGD